MMPNVGDAKRSALVRIPDGRTGRIVFCPAHGAKLQAKVLMPSGTYLSFRREDLTVVDQPTRSKR